MSTKPFLYFALILIVAACASDRVELPSRESARTLDIDQAAADRTINTYPNYIYCDPKQGAWKCNAATPKTPLSEAEKQAQTGPVKNEEPVNTSSPKNKYRQKAAEFVADLVEKSSIKNTDNEMTKARERHEKEDEAFALVHFDFADTALTEYSTEKLNQLMPGLLDATSVTLLGFTDFTGGKEVNDVLALGRADSVRQYLVENGVDYDAITVHGDGKCCYISDNSTTQGRLMNRRVEIYREE